MPKFSVILPVYNVEKYIRQCITSIVNQTFTDFELLIIDDCGNDNSIGIIEEYAKNDERINIIHHTYNKGLGAARNTGLDNACGEYIYIMDSDDWIEPNCLETIYHTFLKHKVDCVWFAGRKFFDKSQTDSEYIIQNQETGYFKISAQNIVKYSDVIWIKAYTKESIERNKIRCPEGVMYDDGEFYFKYFAQNPSIYSIDNCFYHYRIREGSAVMDGKKGKFNSVDFFIIIRNIKKFLVQLGIYEKYKPAILELINSRIDIIKSHKEKFDEVIKLSNEIINEFNFPSEFEKFKTKYPLVSVIVPIYNVEKYVKECIQSIQGQTYNNIEIICVDDCGSDNSLTIVEEAEKYDPRIKIIKHENNKSLGGARNTGLKNAQGEYIFFVDSDDYIKHNCIEKVVSKMIETQCDTVWYKADVLWEEAGIIEHFWNEYYSKFPEGHFSIDKNNMLNFPLYAWNKGYKKSFLIDNNIFFDENMTWEDMKFYFQVYTHSHDTYMLDDFLYVYRRRDSSILGESIKGLPVGNDLYKATTLLYDYLIQNDYYDEYKTSFEKLLLINLKMFDDFPSAKEKYLPAMKKCLEYVGF